MKTYKIAIDGPASSGKSTIAKLIATKLGYTYIDTGAMYRAITWYFLKHRINIEQQEAVNDALANINVNFDNVEGMQHVLLNGQDITTEIRNVDVTSNVSEVSAIAAVRECLVSQQQAIAESQSVVMDGRDIGTVVLPKADYKFFFVADPHVRALRRYNENIDKGMATQTLEEIEQAIIERDYYDTHREHSPLKKAEDAIEIDTSHLTIDEVIGSVIQYIQHSHNKD